VLKPHEGIGSRAKIDVSSACKGLTAARSGLEVAVLACNVPFKKRNETTTMHETMFLIECLFKGVA
jgi:hypothetical protein